MKKYILLTALILALLLQGCQAVNPAQTEPKNTTTSQPPQTITTAPPETTVQPTTTTPPETTVPPTTAPPETEPPATTISLGGVDPELFAALTARFDKWGSWHNMALSCEYKTPIELDLRMFFYPGFDDEKNEPTAQEYPLLKELLTDKDLIDWMATIRLPVSKMDAALQEVFGITTADFPEESFEEFRYLPETNCYYFFTTGTHFCDISAYTGAEMLDDGSIRISYIQNKKAYAVTMKPVEDRYIIWSNLPVE